MKRFLPSREFILKNFWLRRFAPTLLSPNLWHMGRRSTARAVAIGLFFGILLPVGHIPFAALGAVAFRANMPVAICSTFVINPVTIPVLLVAAHGVGTLMLHSAAKPPENQMSQLEKPEILTSPQRKLTWVQKLYSTGKFVALGLFVMAAAASIAGYFLVMWLWRFKVARQLKRRQIRRTGKAMDCMSAHH